MAELGVLERATWEPHCGAGGARMADAKKADLGPLGSAPSKAVTSPGCFSPGPGEPLKIFFFSHLFSRLKNGKSPFKNGKEEDKGGIR